MYKRESILIVTATEMEMEACRSAIHGCHSTVTGMGAAAAAAVTLSAIEKHRPKLVIQTGIAGAIDKSLAIGQSVVVTSDFQADLGAWRGGVGALREIFCHSTELRSANLPQQGFVPFESTLFEAENPTALESVSACSVNLACSPLIGRAAARIETMEGAAFFQAAATSTVTPRAIQLRTISNYIDSPREEWDIESALAALPAAIEEVFGALSVDQPSMG